MKTKIQIFLKQILKVDWLLLLCVFTVLLFGLVFIYSSSSTYAQNKGFSDLFYFFLHLKKVMLGVIVFFITFYTPFWFWQKYSRLIGFLSLLLLTILLVSPNAVSLNGAKRWIFGIQPSEFAKLGFILFFSQKIVTRYSLNQNFKKDFLNSLFIVGIFFGLLLLQPDYSSGIVLLVIAFSILFYGGCNLKYMFISIAALVPILISVILITPYRFYRLISFFETSNGYQLSQSLISLGSGGLFGVGVGEGTQKLGYLPMPFTDTVFSIIGEEIGFFGVMLFYLFWFSLLVFRGFIISSKIKDKYTSLVVLGSTVAIMITGLMHIGVCIGFLPVTGQPLPFISYGGSALIINLALTGFIAQGSCFKRYNL